MRRLSESSAFGPLCASSVRTCDECARRSGRYPVRAPTVAVGLPDRLHCDARSAVAPRNSLHSLRSLRSNSLGESDERSTLRAPTALLRVSPPHKSPPPDTAHRAATPVVFDGKGPDGAGKAVGGYASAATYAAPRSTGLVAARVSALRLHTRRDCPSATTGGSEASFATGHETEHRREPGAQRRAAAFERRRIPARGFAPMHGRQVAKRWSH
jgi:hypothetical protein